MQIAHSYIGGLWLGLISEHSASPPDDSIIYQCPLSPSWVGSGIMSSTQLHGH